MKKFDVKRMFIPGMYLVAVLAVIGCVILTAVSINKYLTEQDDFDYTVNGLIDDESVPVQGEENNGQVENNDNETNGTEENQNNENTIIRPYNSENVTVGRYFYDFEDDAKSQEHAIIYYENTYMQNSGVDYISETVFDVVSVLSGKVVSVEEDDILGNIIKVEHENKIISVYQGVDKVAVKEGDTVTQGQVIATSGNSSINSNYTTSLHFEVYYNGTLMDPENFYTLNLDELKED